MSSEHELQQLLRPFARPRVMMGRHVLGTEAKEVFCCWIKKVGKRLKQIKMFMEQQYNPKFKSIEKMKVLANK
jgi:hypothetical protein